VCPFSGSDHHLIVGHFYARGICADSPPHRIISVRNFQKMDKDKLDEIFMCDDIWDMFYLVSIMFQIVWSLLI